MALHLEPEYFRLSEAADPAGFPSGFDIPYELEELVSKKETIRCYDTFDWKAWNKKSAVLKQSGRLAVIDLETGKEAGGALFRKNPAFFLAGDIPDPKLGKSLENISRLRAFIRLCTIETLVRRWRVLDGNRKTVAALELRRMTPAKQEDERPLEMFARLMPVRGYREERTRITECFASRPELAEKACYRDLFTTMLDLSEQRPGAYSSKPRVTLDPDDTIQQSARKLLTATLNVMRANEPWLPKNMDTEFLHDYRVAIRRTRSILAQLRGIFPPSELTRFKQRFRDLGKRTNDLRDQDVYLLEADRFRGMLPDSLQDGLDPFFTDLGERHKKELKKFSRYLASARYASELEEWRAFLESEERPDPQTAPNADKKTSEIALDTIRKAWKKVLRHGRNIGREATDAELHVLRIDCKKLRYLLEFFSSLFPGKMIRPAVRQLKTLQDNLGAFVDLSVQEDYLQHHLLETGTGRERTALAASLGGLVTMLHHEREKVRKTFHKTFDRFDSQETEALFRKLFNHYG